MENYDFRTNEKLAVFYIYNIKAKKYILTSILGNLIFSLFIISYVYKLFTIRKYFHKYLLLILEFFNVILTLLFISLYLRVSTFSYLQSMWIYKFYFLYTFGYLLLYFFYCMNLCYQIIKRKMTSYTTEGWTILDIILVFIPLFGILFCKINSHFNFYFAVKQIEYY